MNHWIMDYETLSNCFIAVFEHYKTSERKVFTVHKSQNDFKAFLLFLGDNIKNKEWHISYNGLAFDAQVTQHILDNCSSWDIEDADQIASMIYQYATSCIQKSNAGEFLDYPHWKIKIGQIDIFKMHHWDNPAKRSSLKWIQYSMDWDDMIDMPLHHSTQIETPEQIEMITKYCINDVRSTKEIFNRSKSQIALRKELTKTYGINLFSASEPRISKELFAYYLSDKLGKTKSEIKKLRTFRRVIKFKDIILPYVKFNAPEFKLLHERFKAAEIMTDNLRGGLKYKMEYKDVVTHFGLGGVHGARRSGIFESDDEYIIMSSDVTSFYPNLAIKNRFSPGHFPEDEFCDQYEWFFKERKKIPKSNPMNYVYKIILNSTFGLSNDKNSFFYDPELCMKITINGQLTLMMLYEMIMERIPNATALMQNTDGVETIIPRKYVDEYMQICKEWEEITNLNLEHDQYEKLILGDVNNYIGVFGYKETDMTTWRDIKKKNPHYLFKIKDGKFLHAPAKMKGRFDFHNLQLHKNKSKLIIKKAIYHYFVHNILPRDFLKNNRNILDYCIGGKSKGDWVQVARSLEKGLYKEDKLQKINRYYISKSGIKIVKVNQKDNREVQLEAGKWMQTIFNKIDIKPKWEQYDVDEAYYINAIEQEINNILAKPINQLKLF